MSAELFQTWGEVIREHESRQESKAPPGEASTEERYYATLAWLAGEIDQMRKEESVGQSMSFVHLVRFITE